MRRASATVAVQARRIAEVEELWYDRKRWASFVDGLKHVHAVEGDYPAAGARVVWDSFPGGRGRVIERVLAYEPRAGQELAVEDEKIRGNQRVRFTPLEDGVRIGLELDYELKDAGPLSPITDLLFIRRAQADSLRRTLLRFRRELIELYDPAA